MRTLALMFALASAAASQETPPRAPSVEETVRDLESKEPAVAYRAAQRLVDLGDSALPKIESLKKGAPDRTRALLEVAAREIRVIAELKDDYPPVPRVSISEKDKNLGSLLEELSAKSGLKVRCEGDPEDASVEIQDATPLEALEAICKAGNGGLSFNGGELHVNPGNFRGGPRFFFQHSVFRIDQLSCTRVVRFRGPSERRIEVYLSLYSDPRLKRLYNRRVAEIVEAVDEKGRSLLLPSTAPGEPDEFSLGLARLYQGHIYDGEAPCYVEPLRLLWPSLETEKIAVLRGFVTFFLPKSKSSLTFETVKEGERDEREGFSAVVKSAGSENGCPYVDLEVSSKGIPEEELRKKIFRAELLDKKGERLTGVSCRRPVKGPLVLRIAGGAAGRGRMIRRMGPEEVEKLPEIAKIKLTLIKDTLEHKVPFEFRDVKLK